MKTEDIETSPNVELLDGERWKAVQNFPGYLASTCGRIYSSRSLRLLKQGSDTRGYPKVSLTNNAGRKTVCVHRVVLETFDRARCDGEECRHLDGNQLNNNLSNLAWGTGEQNRQDRQDRIAHCKPRRLLTTRQVAEIYERYFETDISQKQLAEQYGVNGRTVTHIVTGKTWQSVTGSIPIVRSQSSKFRKRTQRRDALPTPSRRWV